MSDNSSNDSDQVVESLIKELDDIMNEIATLVEEFIKLMKPFSEESSSES